jgi:hypothetical protein
MKMWGLREGRLKGFLFEFFLEFSVPNNVFHMSPFCSHQVPYCYLLCSSCVSNGSTHYPPLFFGPKFQSPPLVNHINSPKKKTIIGGGHKWAM